MLILVIDPICLTCYSVRCQREGNYPLASVCLCVYLFVNMITSKRLNIGWWNLAVRCIVKSLTRVRMSRSKVKVTGDRKRKSAAICLGVVLWGTVLVRHFFQERSFGAGFSAGLACVLPVLRRWENQHMLSSSRLYYLCHNCFCSRSVL